MASSLIEHLAQGRYSFLLPMEREIYRVLPQAAEILPRPQRIFLEDEQESPLWGYPVLLSPQLAALEEALADYLEAEQAAQAAYRKREPFDSGAYADSWERYRGLLGQALENVTLASHGGIYGTIFWLHHSRAVSQNLEQVPRRLRRIDLQVGRDHGDEIKYAVFDKWHQRVVALQGETAGRLAAELAVDEAALSPALFQVMCDNLLIFTESYISPDLSELASYLAGRLGEDGRDFRRRLLRLEEWHRKNLEQDEMLRSAARHLLAADPGADSRRLLFRAGYVSFLQSHVTYSPEPLFSPAQIELWESLLERLERFEILEAVRRLVVPLKPEDGALVYRERNLDSTGGVRSVTRVSATTRPLDFLSTWVVNPVVERYGLVYDITDFSSTLARLGRAEKGALEEAFRMTSSFQRRIDTSAAAAGLRLEKYLGDGAFYSGRNARQTVALAIRLQRLYPQFVAQGFPFDSGMRLALNFGEYRLLPLGGEAAARGPKYEYFGHGLVELSRLSTGKRTQEIDDFKTYLIAQGYPEAVVNQFFAPMMAKSSGLVSKLDEARRFYAYINPNGALINEGMVATEALIERLGTFPELYHRQQAGRDFIVFELAAGEGESLAVGVRKLGVGKLKGLEPLPLYEIVDGGPWRPTDQEPLADHSLLHALERLFAAAVTARTRPAGR